MSRLQAEGRNLQQLLVERKQMELQMRYGDYLSDLTDTLTTKAAAHIRGMQKQWTDVADELEREEHEGNTEWLDYSEMNPLLQIGSRLQYCIHVRKPLHSKISQACTILDWHVETTVCAIKQYGERNKLVHASVNKMLEQNQWQAFGNRCTDDLNAILGIFDPDDPRVPMYTSFVTRVRDAWVTKPHPRGDWEPLEHIRTARDGKGDIPGLTRFNLLKQVAELPKIKRAGEALLKIIHDIGKGKFKSKEERDRRIDKSKNVNAIKKELKDALNSFDMAVERIASLGEEQKALLGDRDALRVQKEHLEGRLQVLEGRLQVLELQRESEKVVGEPSSPKDDRKSAVATASEQGVLSQMFKSVNDGIKMRL
ncbi:hypothetical protein DOTSEDRAFT_69128 [Dothistroma septosporum NZE10]|uniref:Uncharacterized protein n=1 Tax=Dothistroma septosporum (strain NZE10 / CBS 128990) TaxID=675120 RepID=N1PUB0_DOTSN|nr:hypothetical protein DOTSEDRAFT_69128 [Dothistroma septosporum NZE10]